MLNQDRLRQLLDMFVNIKICVIGDFYLDRYSLGVMECISREAPIPIIRLKNKDCTRYVPGAAGNVAINLRALGANVNTVGVLGNDVNKDILMAIFDAQQVDTKSMLIVNDRMTGAFEKFYASAYHSKMQQVSRVDTESAKPLTIKQEEVIVELIDQAIQDVDGIIVADYAEIDGTGIITRHILKHLVEIANIRSRVVVGDSRLRIGDFQNMIVVPNDYEAAMAVGIYESHSSTSIDDKIVLESGAILVGKTRREVFITRGDKGITLFSGDGQAKTVGTIPLDGEIDPTGAGDTVAASICASLCAGASLEEAAMLSNLAARVTVGKIGTTGTATPLEIIASMDILNGKSLL